MTVSGGVASYPGREASSDPDALIKRADERALRGQGSGAQPRGPRLADCRHDGMTDGGALPRSERAAELRDRASSAPTTSTTSWTAPPSPTRSTTASSGSCASWRRRTRSCAPPTPPRCAWAPSRPAGWRRRSTSRPCSPWTTPSTSRSWRRGRRATRASPRRSARRATSPSRRWTGWPSRSPTRTACWCGAPPAATAAIGEDVTQNLRTIREIPLRLRDGDAPVAAAAWRCAARCTCRSPASRRSTSAGPRRGNRPSPTRATRRPGSLRQLDPAVTASRPLRFFAFAVQLDPAGGRLAARAHAGRAARPPAAPGACPSTGCHRRCADLPAVEALRPRAGGAAAASWTTRSTARWSRWTRSRCTRELGVVGGREPRWAIAYKFAPTLATTRAARHRDQRGPHREPQPLRRAGAGGDRRRHGEAGDAAQRGGHPPQGHPRGRPGGGEARRRGDPAGGGPAAGRGARRAASPSTCPTTARSAARRWSAPPRR